jgi:glycosyltransferase involved in cell wall biosynthesis
MRIMIVTDAWEPQVNGVVRTVRSTRDELCRLGHEVEVLAPDTFRSLPCPTYPEIRLALATRRAVARRIDAFRPDALHIATEGPLGWRARAVARARGWPFSTAYHTRFPEYVHARVRLPVAWSYAVLRRFHNASAATLAATPALVDDLFARGFHGVTLWSRGVDGVLFNPVGGREPRGAAPVFLYVGRLAVEKRIDAFLGLELPGEKWVVGDGPEAARLRAGYPGVRWFGTLHGEALARVYRSADVTVFPSCTDTFGLVLIESMACGTPVAAFPVPGPRDVVGSSAGGVLHEDLRVASLAALRLPRADARAQAERFTWAAATRQFLRALQPIVHGGAEVGAVRSST